MRAVVRHVSEYVLAATLFGFAAIANAQEHGAPGPDLLAAQIASAKELISRCEALAIGYSCWRS